MRNDFLALLRKLWNLFHTDTMPGTRQTQRQCPLATASQWLAPSSELVELAIEPI
jgi:hypothetical protein